MSTVQNGLAIVVEVGDLQQRAATHWQHWKHGGVTCAAGRAARTWTIGTSWAFPGGEWLQLDVIVVIRVLRHWHVAG